MAGKKKTRLKLDPIRPKRRVGRWIALTLAALIALFALGMHLTARIVHVRYADVYLSDLPSSFDGVTLLFASDIDVCGLNTAKSAGRLFDRLQDLHPDILLLGGDYASPSLFDRLNGGSDEQASRRDFFRAVSEFQAPLGKYAVSGDNDGDSAQLALTLVGTGFELLSGKAAKITRGSDTLSIAGIAPDGGLTALAAGFRTEDCVIALGHTPDRIVDIRIAEASNGGPWADLILCGHTHGGQLQVAGHSILSLTDNEKRFLYGWTDEGAPMLVTSGVGCEGANFRLGTQAEVWMITLKSKKAPE